MSWLVTRLRTTRQVMKKPRTGIVVRLRKHLIATARPDLSRNRMERLRTDGWFAFL